MQVSYGHCCTGRAEDLGKASPHDSITKLALELIIKSVIFTSISMSYLKGAALHEFSALLKDKALFEKRVYHV